MLIVVLATAAQAADWTFYRKDLAGTADAGEPLTLDQARALEVTRMKFGGSIFSNPIVANGNLYYTAGDGYLHAVSLATFTEQWRKAIYASGPFHCLPSPRQPPVGAPAVVGTTVFVPGGDGVVYSLDANGNQNWATRIADVSQLGEFLWSSIFPLNGKLYVGVASLHDCLLVPGRLVALDQATGVVVGTWWGDATQGPGAGLWTQPAYDAVSNRIFVTTGTLAPGKTPAQQPWADAFVAIDADKMVTVDSFAPVPNDSFGADNDFGASPTLYDSPDGRHFIAATNKNGWVYALDRNNLANGLIWKYQISGPGTSPDFGEGSIVSAPYANGTLFVAGGTTPDGANPGSIAALDAFTGAQKWIFHPEGFVLGAMTVTGQVLFAGTANAVTGRAKLYALDQATGAVLFQLSSANMFGEPTWANGALYVGDGVGAMYELVPNPLGPQPDFDLSLDTQIARTTAGDTATASVSAVPKNGFNGPVSLTATTAVATPSFNPATLTPNAGAGQAPYTSSLSLATSATGGPIYQTVVVTGTGGGRTRSTAVWLVVSDFALNATAASALQGSSATSTVTVSRKQGFAAPVQLSVSGLPPGTTASFDANPTTAGSTLALQTSSATPPGTYQVQVSGAAGILTHTTTVSLVVSDFALSATAASAVQGSSATSSVKVSSIQGFAAPVQLSVSGLPPGTTASFDPNPATTGSTLTVQTSSATPPGTYQVPVSGAAGALTHTVTFALVVSDFALSATAASAVQGFSATSSVTVSPIQGFAAPVQLGVSGLPQGTTASFEPSLTTAGSTLTLQTTSATPAGTYPVQVSGTAGALTRTVTFALAVTPPPDFELTLGRAAARVTQGRDASIVVAVSPRNGFSGPVRMQADGLPSGTTASWSPPEASSNSTLDIDVGAAAAPGMYTVTVTGNAGAVSRTAQLSIEIVAGSQGTGCSTGGSTGIGTSLLGLFLAARLSRRRQARSILAGPAAASARPR